MSNTLSQVIAEAINYGFIHTNGMVVVYDMITVETKFLGNIDDEGVKDTIEKYPNKFDYTAALSTCRSSCTRKPLTLSPSHRPSLRSCSRFPRTSRVPSGCIPCGHDSHV
jgi:hypothetical protein